MADARQNYREWKAEVREDPSKIWDTAIIRIGLWLLFGLIAYVGIRWVWIAWMPNSAGGTVEAATRDATLYVVCSACGHKDVVARPRDFKAWPLPCPKCATPNLVRAKPCLRCRDLGAVASDPAGECRVCGDKRKAASQKAKPAESRPTDRDDLEDDW
jgi:hypothetical protein